MKSSLTSIGGKCEGANHRVTGNHGGPAAAPRPRSVTRRIVVADDSCRKRRVAKYGDLLKSTRSIFVNADGKPFDGTDRYSLHSDR
jgi:hypothetical protein